MGVTSGSVVVGVVVVLRSAGRDLDVNDWLVYEEPQFNTIIRKLIMKRVHMSS